MGSVNLPHAWQGDIREPLFVFSLLGETYGFYFCSILLAVYQYRVRAFVFTMPGLNKPNGCLCCKGTWRKWQKTFTRRQRRRPSFSEMDHSNMDDWVDGADDDNHDVATNEEEEDPLNMNTNNNKRGMKIRGFGFGNNKDHDGSEGSEGSGGGHHHHGRILNLGFKNRRKSEREKVPATKSLPLQYRSGTPAEAAVARAYNRNNNLEQCECLGRTDKQ